MLLMEEMQQDNAMSNAASTLIVKARGLAPLCTGVGYRGKPAN
jgi:hypothetical protein